LADSLRIAATVAVVLAGEGQFSPALAADPPGESHMVRFAIKPEPLALALNELALQSHQRIAFTPDSVKDYSSPGISGDLTLEDALRTLLGNTGLLATRSADGVILIIRRNTQGPASVPPSSSAPPREATETSDTDNNDRRAELDNQTPERRGFWSRIVDLFTANKNTDSASGIKTKRGGAASSMAALLASGLGLPVHAADVPTASSDEIAEIVVTAARQEQNLQKVSAAVSVIDGSVITSQGLSNIQQIFTDMPSVQTTGQPGGSSIDIRGLGGDLPAGSTQGSVALVFDGVYNINSQSTTVGFFDVNRIEVLPGPQSTRYGPNADGGIVQVITNDPQLGQFGGSANVTAGNYGMVRGEAALNLPIGDTVAVRLAAATLNRDSYFDPAQGAQAAQSFRGKILWAATDDLSLKLSYQLDHIGGAGNGSNAFPMFTNKVPVYPGGSINNSGDPWSQSPSDPENASSTDIYQHTTATDVSYDFHHNVALDWLTSYTTLNGGENGCIFLPPWGTSTVGGAAFCNAELNEFQPFHQITTELRLHNDPGSAILWNAGYYHWNYLEQYSLDNAGPVSSPPVKTTTATNAVYGEVTYPITDEFRVIGGLRESYDHRTFNFNNAGVITPVYAIDFSHFDYRAGLEYDVAQHSMMYFTVASGYRPGGLSSFNPVTDAPNSFKSEVTTSFEFGSKNRFLEGRLQVNVDIFYYKQSNYQNLDKYSGFIPDTGGDPCANGDTRAACTTPTFGIQAHTLGFETQIKLQPTRDDLISFSGTWLHARFNENQGKCATTDAPTSPGCWDGYNSQDPTAPGTPFFFNLAGAVQPHSPDFSGTIGYSRTLFRFGSGAAVSIGGDAFYTMGYWVNPVQDATMYGWQPNYWLGNAKASVAADDGKWSFGLFVRNIGDYAVKESVLPAQSIGDPRTYGVSVGFKW